MRRHRYRRYRRGGNVRRRYGSQRQSRLGRTAKSIITSIFLTIAISIVWHAPSLYDHAADERLLPWSSDIRTVTYSAEIPPGADERAARVALGMAARAWNDLNPDLEFKEVSDKPMTRVAFSGVPVIASESYYHGLATCQSTWISIFEGGRCRIDVYLPSAYRDHDVLTTTIMHELGHVLGMGHTLEPGHLMFTYEGPNDEFLVEPFDDLGYVIPEPLP